MPALTTNYGLAKPADNEYYDINVTNKNMDIIDTALSKCAIKGNTVSALLSVAGWSGSAAPYSQTISVAGTTATNANEILPGSSITADQLDALQAANIQDGGQAAGSLTLWAYGDKPSIDLPIRIIVRRDL